MLYSIIPPILIVVSLIGIIVLLMKKAPDLAILEEYEDEASQGFLKRVLNKKKVSNKLLLILEKITRKIKLMFLKLENVFSAWGDSIKKKRHMKENEGRSFSISERKEILSNDSDDESREFFQRRKSRIKPRVAVSDDVAESERIERDSLRKKAESEKKILEKKDLFEKILIERIAANPKDVEAYERLGEYYFEIENWNYSKECFKQVVKLSPQNRGVKMKMRKLERLLSK